MTQSIIETATVRLDADLGHSKDEVIRGLASTLVDAGRATDLDQMVTALGEREAKSPTGMPGGIAIPHCKSDAVATPSLGFARLATPVDFGAKDGPADLVFLIGAPGGGGKEHLKVLSTLARNLVRKDFVAALRSAATAEEAVEIIDAALAPTPKAESAPEDKAHTGSRAATAAGAAGAGAAAATAEGRADHETTGATTDAATPLRVVAVTACPTGIAHTYMAADALAQEAKEKGVDLQVETQGSSGATPLDPAVIRAADAVIFATDVGVRDRSRFAGKPVIESGVKRAIEEPGVMLEEAERAAHDPKARRVSGSADESAAQESGAGEHWARRLQRAVMTGVSYMIPFVAAGGLLMALGFLIGGYDMAYVYEHVAKTFSLTNLPGQLYFDSSHEFTENAAGATPVSHTGLGLYLGSVLFAIGQAAMKVMVAILSAYIAYALADRPGIAPGFVGGSIAVTVGAGFLGGLVTGIVAGYLVAWMTTWRTPRWLSGLMPVVLIPLLGSLIIGLLMYLVLGRPLAAIMNGLGDWLNGMSGSSALLLGVILGLMMCFDLGGPVNKAAYTFATAGLSVDNPASLKIMAAVMAAGMVPPIALSIATMLRGSLFTAGERENGRAAWLLGLSFISEGAIPFAAADPLRVIPPMMAGGAVTGALCMTFGVESYAPHGGVFVLFAIHPWWGYLIAIAVGCVISTALVIVTKSLRRTPEPGMVDAERTVTAA